MSDNTLTPISAELVAAKLEQIANFELPKLMKELAEQPRLAEVLWFLQFVSQPDNYAGGLARFSHDFIDESAAAEIGTATMAHCRGRAFTFDELKAVFCELSSEGQSHLQNAVNEEDSELLNLLRLVERWENPFSLADISFALDAPAPARRQRPVISKPEQARLLSICTPEKLRAVCIEIARENLGFYFQRLCSTAGVSFHRPSDSKDWTHNADCAPWYFANVSDALITFIDRRKTTLASRLAETEITKLVFEWMSVAHETGRAVLIEGNSRFGKTEAIKLWCDMNPGIARLVNTPATNAIGDLLREVARALGIDSAPGRRGHDLRERIEYVLRFSKLLVCFDEANFLLPGSFSRNTTPARLNWVRRSLMDRKTAAVFVYTPQSNQPAKKRFVKATGYTIEQFDERILMTVHLPNELGEADLMAVARIHFGKLHDAHLRSVVHKVLATERNYISDLEKVATLANYKAKAAGRGVPLLADINAALANVLPVARTAAAARPVAAPGTSQLQTQSTPRARVTAPLLEPNRVTDDEQEPFAATSERETRPGALSGQPV